MADIQLTITAKSDYVDMIMTAFNNGAGKVNEHRVEGHKRPFPWTYTPKGVDTNKQFAQRILAEFIRAFVREAKENIDADRYTAEIQALTPPTQNVPDEIVE